MSLFNSSLPSVPSSSSKWREALGFVPTVAAQAAATPKKVAFLKLVREANPSVGNSYVQQVLLEQISEVCFGLKPYVINWLSRELGNQFLTLCTKEVRESTRNFAIFSLNKISEEVLSGISIKGKKKKRFRDWRDVVFTTVLETPVVEYKNKLLQLPEGYRLVTSNHEMLRAADEFGNCSYGLSDQFGIIQGDQFVLIIPEKNGVEPVMFHGSINEDFEIKVLQAKHPHNKKVPPGWLNDVVTILNYPYLPFKERKRKEREMKEKEEEKKEKLKEIKHLISFFFVSLIAAAFLASATTIFFMSFYSYNNIERQERQ